MQINTRTKSLELTKTELGVLSKAKSLLLLLAKHGEGELAESAETAVEAIGEVQTGLKEPEKVVA